MRLNFFNRDLFNAIQDKDAAAFWYLLFTVFLLWAVVYIASRHHRVSRPVAFASAGGAG